MGDSMFKGVPHFALGSAAGCPINALGDATIIRELLVV
jgi:hypothetical protein